MTLKTYLPIPALAPASLACLHGCRKQSYTAVSARLHSALQPLYFWKQHFRALPSSCTGEGARESEFDENLIKEIEEHEAKPCSHCCYFRLPSAATERPTRGFVSYVGGYSWMCLKRHFLRCHFQCETMHVYTVGVALSVQRIAELNKYALKASSFFFLLVYFSKPDIAGTLQMRHQLKNSLFFICLFIGEICVAHLPVTQISRLFLKSRCDSCEMGDISVQIRPQRVSTCRHKCWLKQFSHLHCSSELFYTFLD